MHIIACVKHILDMTLLKFDITLRAFDDCFYTTDPADMRAVETALKLKERIGRGSVTTVTLGPRRDRDLLKKTLSMGADTAVHIITAEDAEFPPELVASILAAAVRKMQHDLVLCGSKSSDLNNAYVGVGLAAALDLPVVSNVVEICDIDPERQQVKLHRNLGRGRRAAVNCSLPAVLTIEDSPPPRYASLPVHITGLRKPIVEINANTLLRETQAAAFTRALEIVQPKPRVRKTDAKMLTRSASERLQAIMTGGVSEMKAEIFEGTPESCANRIMQFLHEKKLLPTS